MSLWFYPPVLSAGLCSTRPGFCLPSHLQAEGQRRPPAGLSRMYCRAGLGTRHEPLRARGRGTGIGGSDGTHMTTRDSGGRPGGACVLLLRAVLLGWSMGHITVEAWYRWKRVTHASDRVRRLCVALTARLHQGWRTKTRNLRRSVLESVRPSKCVLLSMSTRKRPALVILP